MLVLSLDRCTGELSALVKAADVVVSLLPATMHPPIAELCLQHQKHLVTASYVSPGTSRTMTGYGATCLLARDIVQLMSICCYPACTRSPQGNARQGYQGWRDLPE